MTNPNENEFVEDQPLAAAQSDEGAIQGGIRRAAQKASEVAGDTWEQTKQTATDFKTRHNH